MEIKALDDFIIEKNFKVSLKEMNHIKEICYCQKRNGKITIQLLDKDTYVNLETGEVKECNHIENRSESKLQVSQSLKRLRDYINYNLVDTKKCKWICLTYAENMTDTKRLYLDFDKFIKKLRYHYGHFEYIVAMEPQGRGAWHAHLILIFTKDAPYIPNKTLSELWAQGYTKTQKLDNNIDNIGAYLTAYLGDMELNQCIENKVSYNKNDIKVVDTIGDMKLKTPKKFVKGGRLSMYPPNFNIYRISKGIKKPEKTYMSYKEAKEKIGEFSPTYSKALSLHDNESNFSNTIVYEYYNTKRK